ncbi:MAG: gamma carbonic anhydrase family protein [Thermodesulfobacteriota bacterium]
MIMKYDGKYPRVDPSVFIAENAMVIGDVEIGPGTNIWFHTVVRGDQNYIRIGSHCCVQDACILHVEKEIPLIIEDEVAFGHRAVAHACTIRRGSLIGIGAIVLNGAEIGEESIVGAGSLVTPNTIIPPRTLALGNPAKPVRPLKEKDFELIRQTIKNYEDLKKVYQSSSGPTRK